MIYIVLSILFSTSLFVIFKYFEIFKVNTLQAIVVNYIVAFLIGIYSADAFLELVAIPQKPWLYGAIFLGFLFVTIFFVMALTAQRNGVSVVSIAGKMSVVVPIVFGIVLYKESVTLFKVVGVVIALVAVYLSSVKEEPSENKKAGLLLPILLFFGSGVIDTTLKYVETNHVSSNEIDFFSGSLFGFAASFGLVILLVKKIITKERLESRSLLAGLILGVFNYYSIFFLIKALQYKGVESSKLFTINNVGIVVVSTLLGYLIFKEKFTFKNKLGIVLAIVGILLVATS